MNLYTLINELRLPCSIPDCDISGVTENIDNVTKGSIFVAVKGKSFDGNCYTERALKQGAVCVISEEESENPLVIKTEDTRLTLAQLCSAFYSHPERKLKITGITGTNGKTTVCEYLSHILEESGKKCGVIGTLGVKYGEYYSQTGYTTPSPEILYKVLDLFVKSGCEHCVMEVSSQALEQKRTAPIDFTLAVFTNIGTDHLDRHGTFENYLSAKASLFSQSEKALLNADDINFERMAEKCRGQVFTFSAKDRYADFAAKDIRYPDSGISYVFFDKKNIIPVSAELTGEFSVYNTLAAFSAAEILGVVPSLFSGIVKKLPEIKGRMQKISKDNLSVFIDFAHTPEALQNVLSSLRKNTDNKLFCVFGCGGNRDKGKRPLMGEIAARYSDSVIITSDNPRNENPCEISEDILKGIKNKRNVIVENDRKRAIEIALSAMKSGDCLLVAGKGHEEYQIIGDKKHIFSDEMTVKSILGLI
ncbi:MAG: UDP-N-acetylmuramoyl-L-alanyl-D-glutamate--2,6-diaminopimelate ligase [Clostridia bacterium]|nr:UDP-N-acetylmuramoyl-L-alanyl-D-glutamate--2,6-diaminopimelate ligase [Clostridia bacterium]